ncbi:unnamed protein product [Thelazia callipaeda]|uniref:DUF202 domain-containing protein n=1 Tax=Thelazia callipaeda TaxID=103827 RepID=A0A0N5CTI8_THECL|nr:unnamed protein product [Thelazia callipaeda]
MVDSLSKPSSVILEDGRHVVLKVNRNEDFEMPSRVNPCLKYCIFALSYVLLIIAIGLLSLGFWAQIEKSGIIFHLHKFDPSKVMAMFEPTVLIIITGLIILVISFCGTVGL